MKVFLFLSLLPIFLLLGFFFTKDIFMPHDSHVEDSPTQNPTNALEKLEDSKWIKELSKRNIKHYIYPATEMEIDLDTQKGQKRIFYKIIIGNIDKYKFYCIDELFKIYNFQYSYYKVNKSVNIVVATTNYKFIRKVTSKLKLYEIDYKLSKRPI